MKPVEVFNKEDFESPVFPTPQERADYCNKLLSERLITYYGNEDSEGFMYLGTEQEEGDNFVMIGFKQTIPKEPVKKIELTGQVNIHGNIVHMTESLMHIKGARVKVTVEEL